MGTQVSSVRVWRFGVFEADAQSGELRRNGNLVKLQEQPARILIFLLEHAGEMVTREALRQRLWPPDTFVDFDHSLNTAVKKLREVLGDSADKPLYIETIPRKGYRFVAPVEEVPAIVTSRADPAPNGIVTSPHFVPPGMEEVGQDQARLQIVEARSKQPARTPSPRIRLALLTLAIITVLVISGWFAWHALRKSHLEAQDAASPNLHVVPVTNMTGYVDNPAFSPDGRQIAFTWQPADQARNDIYIQMIGNEVPLRLTHNTSGFVDFPQWSPDGRQVAFTSCAGTRDGIYVAPALGGAERLLAQIDCRYWGWRRWGGGRPTWTADGKNLLFTDRCAAGGPQGVVIFSLDTGGKRCITAPDSPNSYDFMEALSPDGKTVAFLRGTSITISDIYTVPVSGGAARRLTSENHAIPSLMWTPDGHSIVFESDRGITMGTWRIPASGGTIRPEAVYPRAGTFSNQGRFAYAQKLRMERAIWHVQLSSPGGKTVELRKLAHSQSTQEQMDISPDKTRIAFQSDRTGAAEIWLSSRDGDEPFQLTSLGRFSGTPRWSPDGHWIAFDSRPKGRSEIYLIDVEGRNLRLVTDNDFDNITASWSRDGKWIYYSSMRAGEYQVWKHSLADGSELQLTRRGGVTPLESYDGRTIYYTRWHEPGIWSVPVNGGNENLVIAGKPQTGWWGSWAVTDTGLYLMDADAQPRSTLDFYNFSTHKLAPVLRLEKAPCSNRPAVSASRDSRDIFVSECDYQSVVKMMENFR